VGLAFAGFDVLGFIAAEAGVEGAIGTAGVAEEGTAFFWDWDSGEKLGYWRKDTPRWAFL
jgi:hypothetical protein